MSEASVNLRDRATAAFIDISMTAMPAMLVMLLVFGNLLRLGDWASRLGAVAGVGWTALVLIGVGQCLLVGFTGQSYGKLAMRLRVVRTDGARAGLLHGGVVRTLLFGVLWMVPPVALLDVGIGLMRRDGRCLHDLLAGTVVVPA